MAESNLVTIYLLQNFKLDSNYDYGNITLILAFLILALVGKMPKNDTLDALEEHEEHEDDYQTNSN